MLGVHQRAAGRCLMLMFAEQAQNIPVSAAIKAATQRVAAIRESERCSGSVLTPRTTVANAYSKDKTTLTPDLRPTVIITTCIIE